MTAKLRIRGRILLVGNIVLMQLVLATGIMLILCTNFIVLTYELFLKKADNTLLDFMLSLLFLMLSTSVYWVMRLGTDRFFLRRSQQKGGSAADLFCYFHPVRAVGALFFGAALLAVKLFCFILSFAPSAGMLYLLLFTAQRGVSSLVAVTLAVGTVLLIIIALSFYKRISASLFLAKYHYICGDCISFRQAVASSFIEMKNRKRLLLRLKMSFRGWFMLCLLILPVGYVWSYYNQTMAVAAVEFMDYGKNNSGYLQQS